MSDEKTHRLEIPLKDGSIRVVELTEDAAKKFAEGLRAAGIKFRDKPLTDDREPEGSA